MDISKTTLGNLAALHSLPDMKKAPLPILFIHGGWGGKMQFENWMRFATERGFESYAVDLPGHHESPAENMSKLSIDDYARAAEGAIQALGPCYLVGHSMGGLVSQVVASRTPNVKKVVLVDSTPPAGVVYMNAFAMRMYTGYLAPMLFSKPMPISREDAMKFVLNRLDPSFYDTLIPESGRAAGDTGFLRVKVANIPCPVLVVAASDDRAVPANAQKKTADKYNAKYVEIPEMSHMVQLEKGWERPIGEILTWLSS